MKNKAKVLNKIISLVRQGQLKIAFKLLRKQLKSTSDAEVWVKLASICGSSGLKNECVKCCQLAIQLDAECALAYSYLGKVYAETGDAQKALEATRRAIELKENDALIQFQAGYV